MITNEVRKQTHQEVEKTKPENYDLEIKRKLEVIHKEIIGSLMYLTNVSRPYIVHPVNHTARR